MSDLAFDESTIFGRYRVVRFIAEGGMGAVYEVEHVETEGRLALKVMHQSLLFNERMKERFKLEAKISARVKSPHVVAVLDAGIDTATEIPYLVMELLQGNVLRKLVKPEHPLSAADVVTYVCQTASALDKAHQAGIVHRDLKPDNLFLVDAADGAPPFIKVLDFGIAKLLAEYASENNATRDFIGTPLYMAPEQLNLQQVSPKTDIYALGMIAYTLLVGQAYWAEELRSSGHPVAFGLVAREGPRVPASKRAAAAGVTLPSAFDAWFAKAAAPSAGDRFETASEAAAALAEALDVPLPDARSSRVYSSARPGSSSSPSAPSKRTPAVIDGALKDAVTLPSSDLETVLGSVVSAPQPRSNTYTPTANTISKAPPAGLKRKVMAAGFLGAAAILGGIAVFSGSHDGPVAESGSQASGPNGTIPASPPVEAPTATPQAPPESAATAQPASEKAEGGRQRTSPASPPKPAGARPVAPRPTTSAPNRTKPGGSYPDD